MGYDMEKETNDRKQTMMDMTGLREKPLKDKKSNMEQEQPYHMTSIGTSGTGTFSQKIAKRLNFLKGRQPRNPSQTNGYLVIYDLNASGMKQM